MRFRPREPVGGQSVRIARRLQGPFETSEPEVASGAGHGQAMDGPVEVDGRGPRVAGMAEMKPGAQDVGAGGEDSRPRWRGIRKVAAGPGEAPRLERDGRMDERGVRA